MSSDSQWFKKKKAFDSVNWVIQFNNLKRMYKLITSYFQQVVGKTIVGLTEPDCTLLARDHNEQEILKFAAIIITLSVQCERNQYFVEKIQQLDQACQTELMITIESVSIELTRHCQE
jgi:protein HOOK3